MPRYQLTWRNLNMNRADVINASVLLALVTAYGALIVHIFTQNPS